MDRKKRNQFFFWGFTAVVVGLIIYGVVTHAKPGPGVNPPALPRQLHSSVPAVVHTHR